MRNGQAQRELLMRFIRRREAYNGFAINRRWCWNIKEKTLSDMVKKGMLKQIRIHDSHGHGTSHLVPADGQWVDPQAKVTCPECNQTIRRPLDNHQHADHCSMRISKFTR